MSDGSSSAAWWTGEEAERAGLIPLGVRPSIPRYLDELWKRREFIRLIPLGELRARNMHTALGSIWHILNPLLLAAVFFFIFGVVFPFGRAGIENYPAFLVSGIFVYYFTQRTMQQGARAVVNDVKLLQNVNFPAAVLPISALISEGIGHLFSLGAMFVFFAITDVPVSLGWLLVFLVAALQSVFSLGLAFVTSRLTVHFRDTEQLLPYVLRITFYLSGAIFPLDDIGGTVGTILRLNPLYVFIKATRDAAFEGVIQPGDLLYLVAWSTASLVIGFIFFWAHESEYSRAI